MASVLNLLSSDASSTDGSDICKSVLSSSLRAVLGKAGGCATDINNQLKTIDNFTLTVETIKVSGSTATASVQTTDDGKKVISKVTLAHQKAGWRVASIGAL